jgi:putative adhesin
MRRAGAFERLATVRRVALCALVLLAGSACAALAAASPAPQFAETPRNEEFVRTLPLASGGVFALSNVNGSVEVSAWEKQSVEIRARKFTRGNVVDLNRVQIVVDSKPAEISVRTLYPEGEGLDVSVEYHIRVPAHVVLRRLETVNGSVSVRGVAGSGLLRSVNGNVELFDGAGRFDARSTNGNVHIELTELPDGSPISIETVNGSVVLALPANADAELDILSMNGDFQSELPVMLHGALTAHDFRGRLGRGGAPVKVRTVNGGIRVIEARPTV